MSKITSHEVQLNWRGRKKSAYDWHFKGKYMFTVDYVITKQQASEIIKKLQSNGEGCEADQ